MYNLARLTGSSCHIEYHTVNRKKEKAADCIYQDKDRKCNCKNCSVHLEKCFIATYCKYRVRACELQTDKRNESVKERDIYKGISCSLKKGTEVKNKKNTKGIVQRFDKEKRILYIKYDNKVELIKYKYPEAILNGFLLLEDSLLELVRRDKNIVNKLFS